MSAVWNAFEMAVAELWRNRTRTALTSLGILIGVASVIAMVGIGQGATAAIEADLQSIGVNMLMIEAGAGRGPQARSSAPPLDLADIDAVAALPSVAGATGSADTPVCAEAGGVTYDTTVRGVSSTWLHVVGRNYESGRMFSASEDRAGAAVCLLGETVSVELFGTASPIGERVRLGKATCTVIGTLAPLGENMMGMDQDDLVVMPLRVVQRRLLGNSAVGMISVSARDSDGMDSTLAEVDALMRQRRHVTGNTTVDFQIHDTREIASTLGGITSVLTAFLAAVASVSLVVGGIGIMNIMLVSVTERTREIGIRMAIGALESDIRTQFLVEAGVLASFGGLLGVLIGAGATAIGAYAIGVPVVLNPTVILGALAFSALMGVGFGWIPARRAAQLEPIDALRHG